MPKKRRSASAPEPAPAPAPTTTMVLEPVPRVNNLAQFAGYNWGMHYDPDRADAMLQAQAITPPLHQIKVRSGDQWYTTSGFVDTGRNRAEFSANGRMENHRDIWFSYALRPRAGPPVTMWSLVGQFHHSPDEDAATGRVDAKVNSPPFAVEFRPDARFTSGEKLVVVTRTDPKEVSDVSVPASLAYTGGFTRDKWTRLVGRVRFGWNNDGLLQMWRDGAQIINANPFSIGFNDLRGPYWKFGIYRAEQPNPLTVDYANMELGYTPLFDRVANPLPLPTVF